MKLSSDGSSHVGQRAANEDSFLCAPDHGVFVVADGMGGYDGGALASQLVVASVSAALTQGHTRRAVTVIEMEQTLRQALKAAHQAVSARRYGKLSQMGATVAMIWAQRGHVAIAHVGDSRVYRYRFGMLEQLTEDHSLYAMLQAAGVGELPPPDQFAHRSIVTRAIGTHRAEPDTRLVPARAGDVFLLCSDGLSDVLSEQTIAEIIASSEPNVAARALVSEAYSAGADDNITAVVVRIDETDLAVTDRHTQKIVR